MATEYTGGGDPRRSIELLWGAELSDRKPRRGPKPRFTVDQITAIAIDIADRQGLEAVSMRRIAEVLGVTAMSLYSYVPGKDELIDVMVDRAYGELDSEQTGSDQTGSAGEWRQRLERVARQNWDLNLRHPWLLQVATTRPVMGPNLTAKYDRELRAIDGIGLTDVEMDLVLALVTDYVAGAARGAVAAEEVARRTGKTDQEWWAEYAPLLEQVVDPGRYPVGTRVGVSAGQAYDSAVDPARAFEFGLARLLDGIAALLER